MSTEDESDGEADGERSECDEDTSSQFVEVLDKRRLFTVTEAPRQPLHARGLDGVAVALARCNGGVGRLPRQLGRLIVFILAAD
jgi:hypothetical protein